MQECLVGHSRSFNSIPGFVNSIFQRFALMPVKNPAASGILLTLVAVREGGGRFGGIQRQTSDADSAPQRKTCNNT
jgi:hypothetical protein